MSNTKAIREMLKNHGLTEKQYDEVVANSKYDKKTYDDLALQYNAPLGIKWKTLVERYQKEIIKSGQMAHEYMWRMFKKYEADDYEGDDNDFALLLEKGLNENRKKAETKPTTGESAELQQKKAKLHSLYLKYKEKGHSQKEVHNILQARHFPDWSIDTIITYLKK